MVNDHATVWGKCLQTIRRNVNMQSYKTWFEPIKPVRLENNALTIQVPNKFFYEWLEEHYVNITKIFNPQGAWVTAAGWNIRF